MDQKEREALLAGTFEMPMANCELRRHGSTGAPLYAGPGLLAQRDDKALFMRVFAQGKSDVEGLQELFSAFDRVPGQVLPDSTYYDFSGEDQHGVAWTAERVAIQCSFGTNGTYVTVPIRLLEGREPFGKVIPSSTAHAVVPGAFEFPWHLATTTPTSYSLDRFEGESDKHAWKLRKLADRLEISFTVKDGLVGDEFYRFLAGLSVLCGKALDPVVVMIGERGERIRRLKSQRRPKWTAKLAPPLSHLAGDATHAHAFLTAYMTGTLQQHPEPLDHFPLLHELWHKTLRTANDFEIGGLVVSVNIEALLNERFLSEADNDDELIQDVDVALAILSESAMPQRAKDRAISSLTGVVKPKPKQLLERIRKQGFIEARHAKAWMSLRNHAAHGGGVDDSDPASLQSTVDKFHACLDLFYRLLFVIIGYRGQHRDFATKGWPMVAFGLTPEATKPPKP